MKDQGKASIGSTPCEVCVDCQSPSRTRSRCDHAIPPGTVASRVRQLQTKPNPVINSAPPTFQASIPLNRHREQSRAGFGRRISPRFGHPASRSDNPDEHRQVESQHSFLGLTTARNNHEQEHAIATQREFFVRTPGLHGMLEPMGRVKGVQYDAASPWFAAPRPKPSAHSKTVEREEKVSKETGTAGNKSRAGKDTSVFPGLPNEDGNRSGGYLREIKSHKEHHEHHERTLKSDNSFRTTSSVRRKSVRDLFKGHGIERPAGLGSREPSRRQHDISGDSPTKVCHICSRFNIQSNTRCHNCDHALCMECIIRASQPIQYEEESTNDSLVTKEKQSSKPLTSDKAAGSTEAKHQQRESGQPNAWPDETQHSIPGQEVSSPVEKFPPFHGGLAAGRSYEGRSKNRYQNPMVIHQLEVQPCQSRVTTEAKMYSSVASHMSPTGGRSRRLPLQVQPKAAHDHSQDSCEPGSSHKRTKHRSMCETDNGYVADMSYVEDESNYHSRLPSCTYSSRRKSHSSRLGTVSESAHQQRSRRHSETISCEYVECHGYPRTGHARHGSYRSGDIGECQHCQDDCQCKACQRTHHSVRCCVHGNHSSLVHQHHTHKLTGCDPQPIECSSRPTPSHRPAWASRTHTASPVTPSTIPRLSTPPTLKQESESPLRPKIDSPKKTSPNTPSSECSVIFREAPSSPRIPTEESTPTPRTPKTRNTPPSNSGPLSSGPKQGPNYSSELPATAPDGLSVPNFPSNGTSTEPKSEQIHTSQIPQHVSTYRMKTSRRSITPRRNFQTSKGKIISPNSFISPNVGVPSRKDAQLSSASYGVSTKDPPRPRGQEEETKASLRQNLHEQEMRQTTQECEDKLEAISRSRDETAQRNRIKARGPKINRTSCASIKAVTPETKGTDPCAICLDNELNNLEHTLKDDEHVSIGSVDDSLYRCDLSEVELISDIDTEQDTEGTSSQDGIAKDQDISVHVEECQTSHHQEGIAKDRYSPNYVEECQSPKRQDKVFEEGTASIRRVDAGLWIAPSLKGKREHDCIWKHESLDDSNGHDGNREVVAASSLLGITVIIHIEGRDNLVIRSDLREGEHVTTTTQITSC